ncbi:Hypothetical predicted protein [Podarcis lilfordi]|uniref:Uncharacterized protein n=1 Tax=Podarcis lilfordi TaxID=74358 RepID=A0AA35NX17_9SAUR|nr:Hypothetical predicted protein [Podarcis lilfordi]
MTAKILKTLRNLGNMSSIYYLGTTVLLETYLEAKQLIRAKSRFRSCESFLKIRDNSKENLAKRTEGKKDDGLVSR